MARPAGRTVRRRRENLSHVNAEIHMDARNTLDLIAKAMGVTLAAAIEIATEELPRDKDGQLVLLRQRGAQQLALPANG